MNPMKSINAPPINVRRHQTAGFLGSALPAAFFTADFLVSMEMLTPRTTEEFEGVHDELCGRSRQKAASIQPLPGPVTQEY